VYDQVLADLTEASRLMTDDVATNRYYGSLQAVNCMFSRVYLYMEDWTNALKYARMAIGSQQLAQGNDYLGMYDDLTKQGEAIFRLSGDDMNGYLKAFYQSSCEPSDTLLSLFDGMVPHTRSIDEYCGYRTISPNVSLRITVVASSLAISPSSFAACSLSLLALQLNSKITELNSITVLI
jgi:hypothetical protein